jgi:hypothetical protein
MLAASEDVSSGVGASTKGAGSRFVRVRCFWLRVSPFSACEAALKPPREFLIPELSITVIHAPFEALVPARSPVKGPRAGA